MPIGMSVRTNVLSKNGNLKRQGNSLKFDLIKLHCKKNKQNPAIVKILYSSLLNENS